MSKKEKEPIIATHTFDAATIDPRNQGSNGITVYNYQPFADDIRTKVINTDTNANGRFDDEKLDSLKYIQKFGKDHNIIFQFVASDSDSRTNQLHKKFQKYIEKFQGNSFHELIKYIDGYSEMISISDWLNLCKNLRSRFVTQKTLLFKNSYVNCYKSIKKKIL